MQLNKIAFIGAGNMAAALVGGLRASGFDPRSIIVTDRVPDQLARMREAFGVGTAADNAAAVEEADLVVLAVKPQNLARVGAELLQAVQVRNPLVISVAAGVRLSSIAQDLGGFRQIVRAMPNRPALVRKGVTALFAPPAVSSEARGLAEKVFQAVGEVVWLESEEQMDAVTAVSGSGPAYFFLLMELLEEAARELGLPAQTARTLALHTAHGAGCMAIDTARDPAELRAQVTSPGGTTAAALAELENADVRGIVRRAVSAACRRSAELSK